MGKIEKILQKITILFFATILFTGTFAASPLLIPSALAEPLTDKNGFPKTIESFHFDYSNSRSLVLNDDATVIDKDNPYLYLDGYYDYAKISLSNYKSYRINNVIYNWRSVRCSFFCK